MSLDITLEVKRWESVYGSNITHNLGPMAEAAGLYQVLWHPEESLIVVAEQLISYLREGLAKMAADPVKYKALAPENGWGDFEGFAKFVEDLLDACEEYPSARVRVSI